MMLTIRENRTDWADDLLRPELATDPFASAEKEPNPARPSATASLVLLQQGLYALEIDEIGCLPGQLHELKVPLVQVSAVPDGNGRSVEIIDAAGGRETWLGREGGTLIVKSPSGGGCVLVTAYGLPAQAVRAPEIEVRRLDRLRSNGAALRSLNDASEEIDTEIILHMERLGDRRFPGRGWIGNRGKKLRIEAFSIRPTDTLMARDIEFMALGPNRRQTPWVTDAKLCGTRGQGLPLTGFAVRPAQHVAEQFDVVYQGAFFEGGIVGPSRNGQLCASPMADDPLEAINLRLIRRPVR